MKIVVIGANAAGAKAASKAKRMNPSADITVVDKGAFISYGACGIPYYIEDIVNDEKELMKTPVGVMRTPEFFQKVKGVKVLTNTEAISIDRKNRKVIVRNKEGASDELDYDKLVLATGSSPIKPKIEGCELPGVFTIKSIEDAKLLKNIAVAGKRACVVGAGLIGLEIVEALKERGLQVTVIEICGQILPGLLDPEMAALLEQHIRSKGVETRSACCVKAIIGNERVEKVITENGELETDLVALAVGVRPNAQLAIDAGLSIGETGAILVDDHMRTSDPNIFAAGDCCETNNILTGGKIYAPMGSIANKQGRVAGINAAGGDAVFRGALGTAIVKVFDFNAGKTGLTEIAARSAGFDVETVLSPASDRAHFYPTAKPIALKMVADKKTGRLLGLQAVGAGAIDKRLDVAATALTFQATVDQISQLDLAYAPPYSAAMDNLIVAADIMKNKLSGEAKGISPREVKAKIDNGDDFVFLDVRSPAEYEAVRIPGAKLIPLGALREKMDTLPRDKEIITFCKISLRGYEAQKILEAGGFKNVHFMDGGILTWPYELEK